MADGTYVLYGRAGGGSDAPQVVLEELNLPYEFVLADDVAGYDKICPTGKIPALKLPDGTPIFESAAIVIHLTNLHPGLAPKIGTTEHAKFLQWMVYLSANVYEAALRIYYPARYTTEGEAHVPVVKAKALADFERCIGLAEAALSPYLLGKDFSAADLYLYMLANWHPDGLASLAAKFPKLAKLSGEIAKRPAVAKVAAGY